MLLKIHERKVNNIYNKLNVNRSYREKKIILTKKVEPILREEAVITPVKKIEAIIAPVVKKDEIVLELDKLMAKLVESITPVAKPRAKRVVVKSTNPNLLTEHDLLLTKVYLKDIIDLIENEKDTIQARVLLNKLIYKLKS